MQTPLLNTSAQIKSYAEKTFGHKFESVDDAFLDAYNNGEFHEHDPGHCWYLIAASLTDEMIAQFVPTVLRPLVNHAQSDQAQMKKLMQFHEEMAKWLQKRLTSTDGLIQALRDTRDFLIQDAKRDPKSKAWLVEALRVLGLIHIAIEVRWGLATHNTITEYERLIEKLGA